MKKLILLILLIFTLQFSSACSASPEVKLEETQMTAHVPLVIAHRGAASLAPENTLASARKAYVLGADLWELDVAVTADHELFLLHDDTLERTCNAKEVFPDRSPWQSWDFTLEEIRSLDCGSWFNRKDPFDQIKAGAVTPEDQESYVGEKAPTLREALEFTHENEWRVNIELKEQPNEELGKISIEKTVGLINELGMDDGRQVVISSFNHDYLKQVRALNPKIPVQVLTSKLIPDLPEYLAGIGAQSVNPKYNLWNYKKISAYEQDGVQFNVWTVDDELVMKAMINSGVHGIITNFPQDLIALQKAQG